MGSSHLFRGLSKLMLDNLSHISPKQILQIFLLSIVVSGCGEKAAETAAAPAAQPWPAPAAEPAPVPPAETAATPRVTAAVPPQISQASLSINGADKIKAALAATPIVTTPGPPGDLRVWIGDINYSANFPSGMNVASAVIDTAVKPSTVLVVPNAPAFEVRPELKCAKFDPLGTTVNFQITPKFEQNETYRVGARIEIYDNDNCSGTPVPKAAEDIYVKVAVSVDPGGWKLVRENLGKLLGGLLALVVAFILFMARNFLKKVFGFKDEEKD